jgi:hypothetical protein
MVSLGDSGAIDSLTGFVSLLHINMADKFRGIYVPAGKINFYLFCAK